MIKVSYSREKDIEKLQGDFAFFLYARRDGYKDKVKHRHAFLKDSMPGWVVLEAVKNFVPADFIDNKKDIQRIREGWQAVNALKKTLQQLANPEVHPGIAMYFEKDRLGVSWNLIYENLKDLFEVVSYVDWNVDLNDYCAAVAIFNDMIVSGFEDVEPDRRAFWEDFVYRICEGDVPMTRIPDYIKARENPND